MYNPSWNNKSWWLLETSGYCVKEKISEPLCSFEALLNFNPARARVPTVADPRGVDRDTPGFEFFHFHAFLPAATKLGQGNIFTRVCDSVNREGVSEIFGGVWNFFTGWNEVLAKVMFLQMSVILSTGGGVL